jgi:hypothetical protein
LELRIKRTVGLVYELRGVRVLSELRSLGAES